MSDSARYVLMTCACGANWFEDRMAPGPACPMCGHQETWGDLDRSPLFSVDGPGQFGVPASHLFETLQRCAFKGRLSRPKRGHVEIGLWRYEHSDAATRWTISVEVGVHKGEDVVRSVILDYCVDGKAALSTTVGSARQLLAILETIVVTIADYSSEPVAAAEGLFCGAPLETA